MRGAATITTALMLGLLALAGIASALGPEPIIDQTWPEGNVGNCPHHQTDLNYDCELNSGDQLAWAVRYLEGPREFATYTPEAEWERSLTPTLSTTDTPQPIQTPTVALTMTVSLPSSPATATSSATFIPTVPPTFTPTPTVTSTATLPSLSFTLTTTATSTPISTPSISSTVAPSPTIPPTPTPTSPSAYSVEDLIFDTTGPHDGTLCDPPRSWSWGEHGERQGVNGTGQIPSGATQFTAWGVYQQRQCGQSAGGTQIQARNLRILVPSWSARAGGFEWCEVRAQTTIGGGQGCSGSAGNWTMPGTDLSLHWATNRRALDGASCFVVLVEYRKVGAGQVMANAGADAILSNGTIWGLVVGRFVLLTEDWRQVGASSCSDALLRQNPPL